MGLSDRDYARQPSMPTLATRGRGWVSTLSVNTCLIIICVAVFIIDGFLPIVDVPTGTDEQNLRWVHPDGPKLDKGQLQFGSHVLPDPANNGRWRSVYEKTPNGPGQHVGWQRVLPMHWLTAHLHFSTRLGGLEFWRFLGFQFLHANVAHLVFNMIGLFFFGPIVEEYLGRKRYLAFYLLCGCCGALMYLILNGVGYLVQMQFGSVAIPGLLFSDPSTPLVGASAGIFGVIMAGAFLAPNAMAVYLIFPMKLRTLAYFLVGLALFTLVTGGNNAGGEAGHLGGAIAGAYFIRHSHHLHNFFDILGRVDPTSHHYKDGKPGSHAGSQRWRSHVKNPAEIDRILDKINREGLPSLTDEEKRALAEASKR